MPPAGDRDPDRDRRPARADQDEDGGDPSRADGGDREAARRRVLAAVRAIPEGFVRTYGDLSPGAPRFTGTVLRHAGAPAADDAPLPWWRVVRADGSLTQGERQRALLDAEGVPFTATDPPRVDLRAARLPAEPGA